MKILHISTSINGGAGISAYRLHKALLSDGIDSFFMSKDCENNEILRTYSYNKQVEFEKYTPPELSLRNYFNEKLFKKYSKHKSRIADKYNSKKDLISPKVKGKFEIFTSPYSLYDLIDTELYDRADIIHLHWISNYLDFLSFFRRNTKPIVWTFHDLNPVMGGYHYYVDLNRNTLNQQLDTFFKDIKHQILSDLVGLTIVTPSHWLKQKLITNNLIKSSNKVFQCNYHIDSKIFQPLDRTFCRQIFNLPNDKIVFMFVAEDLNNYRKGFDLIKSFILDVEFQDVYFLIVGEKKDSSTLNTPNILYTGKIWDEKLMSIAYNCANYFVLPSREDNLPNTMLESLVSGTPVISFDISDCKEILEKNNIGLVCPEISSDSLKEIMINCLNNDYIFKKNEISEIASFLFNESTVVNFYNNLYLNILHDKYNYS